MNKLRVYSHLIRLHAPVGYALLFLPCLFGLGISITQPKQLWYIPLFFVGAFVMRSAGCIINDIWDRGIDAQVDRTKNRPLAIGALSAKEVTIILGVLMLCGLVILLTLPATAIIVGLCTVPLIIIYPLMKRVTYFPQVVLGMSFGGAGVPIAYATVMHTIDLPAVLLYIGCIFWTLGYDGIYAFMDAEDDAKIGVKSIALFLRDRNYKAWLMCFYVTFIVLVLCSALLSACNFYIWFGGCAGLLMLMWQIRTLDINSRDNCMIRFKNNGYVGLVIGVSLISDKLGA